MNKYTQFAVSFKGETFPVWYNLINYFEDQAYRNPTGEIDLEFPDYGERRWYATEVIDFCREATKVYYHLIREELRDKEQEYLKRTREEKDKHKEDNGHDN